jgi:GNAT superfamily N-acetyltransferase
VARRAAKALTLSLVAEADGRVIWPIAFSLVSMSDGPRNWYGLGPVSVLPAYQRQGNGKALIHEGLSRLKGMNARGGSRLGRDQRLPRPAPKIMIRVVASARRDQDEGFHFFESQEIGLGDDFLSSFKADVGSLNIIFADHAPLRRLRLG